MKLLVDQCIYKETIDFLRKEKIEIAEAKDVGLSKALDSEILDYCKKHNYILLTRDKDFGNVIIFPPKLSHGIIVLKIYPENMESIHYKLLELLMKNKVFEGLLFVIDKHKVRTNKGID